jgi:hypothetical protein
MRIERDQFLCAVAAIGGVCGLPASPGAAQPVVHAAAGSQEPEPAPAGEGESPSSGGDDNGTCRAKPVARPNVCDDNRGSPGDCRKADCRRLPFICQHCEEYKRTLKPKIAERAVACVVAQAGAQLSDGCRTYQCGDEALGGACLDPTADPACWAVAKSCNTSVDECRGFLSGMNDAGRQKVLACALAGCPYGLWSCVEGL